MKVIGNPLPEIGDDAENTVIESKAQLVEYLESGCKPPERFRLGSEQEKFVYRSKDYSPAAYDGPDPGIRALLESMSRFGWKPIDENGLPIGLCKGDRAITLEPGSQLERASDVRIAEQILDAITSTLWWKRPGVLLPKTSFDQHKEYR